MQIIRREMFESGKSCGQLYEPAGVSDDDCGGIEMQVNLRVVRRAEDRYEIIPSHDTYGLQFKGAWNFTLKDFREFAGMALLWQKKRFDLGGYRFGWHSSTYFPPGKKSGSILVPIKIETAEGIHRTEKHGIYADSLRERAVFANKRDHPVGLVFDWQGMGLYWIRDRLGIIRGRSLTPEEETAVVVTGLTIRNATSETPDHMVLSADDASYFGEVALVAASEAPGMREAVEID